MIFHCNKELHFPHSNIRTEFLHFSIPKCGLATKKHWKTDAHVR